MPLPHPEIFPGTGAPERPRPRAGTVGERREALRRRLGPLPPRDRPPRARLLTEEDRDGFVLERLVLELDSYEPVPALLVRPRGVAGRLPAVLYNHSHGGGYSIGKRELLEGREYLVEPPWGPALARSGRIALAIDHFAFGERSHTSEEDLFKAMLWQGEVLWGRMVGDSLRALDWLLARPDVDPARIATLGMSMGSTMAWWLGALEERARVVVDLFCLTDFHALLERGALGEHGIYYYVPGLLGEFTTAAINALIAPRPHLALAGLADPLTPPEGLEEIDRELREVYARAGAPEAWRLVKLEGGHRESPRSRQEALRFLDRWL